MLNDRLTLELGLRYDYYSVVKEADDRAKPFFVEENDFGAVGDGFYNADKNNFSPRLSAAYQFNDKTALRGRLRAVLRAGPVRGPHPADRELHHAQPRAGLGRPQQRPGQYPVPASQLRDLLSIRGYTHDYPNEYNMQYGASLSRELPGAINLTVGYTGSQGKDMFLRGVGNVLDPVTRVRLVPSYGQIDFKTAGCVDGISLGGVYPITGCGTASYDALQLGAVAAVPRRPERRR